MIKINGTSFKIHLGNNIRNCQATTKSKLTVNTRANKVSRIGADALAAIVIGSLGAVNCTKQETPDELSVQQITNNNEEATSLNDESVSYTQATLMSLPTPALRLDYICSELGFDNPIYYSKNKASVIKINNGTQYDEVYTQKIDGTDTSGSEIWLGGVNVHRNTGDVNTSNTGVQYSMTMKNGENGSIIITKKI